jgi:hypothetical protein
MTFLTIVLFEYAKTKHQFQIFKSIGGKNRAYLYKIGFLENWKKKYNKLLDNFKDLLIAVSGSLI